MIISKKKNYNKVIYFFSFVEIVVLVALWLIKYYSENKMGMMRHVTYWNTIFEHKLMGNYQITLRYSALILGIVLFFFLIKKYGKSINVFMMVFSISILTIFLIFNYFYSVDKIFTYYYGVIATYIVTIIEFIKLILFRAKWDIEVQ